MGSLAGASIKGSGERIEAMTDTSSPAKQRQEELVQAQVDAHRASDRQLVAGRSEARGEFGDQAVTASPELPEGAETHGLE